MVGLYRIWTHISKFGNNNNKKFKQENYLLNTSVSFKFTLQILKIKIRILPELLTKLNSNGLIIPVWFSANEYIFTVSLMSKWCFYIYKMMGLTEAKLFSANGILMALIDSIKKGRCCFLFFATSV